jgi:hypothetical protein
VNGGGGAVQRARKAGLIWQQARRLEMGSIFLEYSPVFFARQLKNTKRSNERPTQRGFCRRHGATATYRRPGRPGRRAAAVCSLQSADVPAAICHICPAACARALRPASCELAAGVWFGGPVGRQWANRNRHQPPTTNPTGPTPTGSRQPPPLTTGSPHARR